VDCTVDEGDTSSLAILEPRSGKRILAWRVSARLIVTGCSSPERAADLLSLSVALSGLAILVLVFPRLTPWAKDLALLRSAVVAFGEAAIHNQIVLNPNSCFILIRDLKRSGLLLRSHIRCFDAMASLSQSNHRYCNAIPNELKSPPIRVARPRAQENFTE
jgi:hypothetical protein